ncbi:MAG TPA: hypothetical protein DEF02_03475, partial [Clostridiales bacterium]|nr:hypothetical protein [Clostridiales bacterium]
MAKRKKDTESTSVVQIEAISETEDGSNIDVRVEEVLAIEPNETSDNSTAQDDYVIEMRHITKEFPGI